MPSLRAGAMRLAVLSNDHAPPHVHVFGPGWEIKIELGTPPALIWIKGAAKRSDVASALQAVAANAAALEALWRKVHG